MLIDLGEVCIDVVPRPLAPAAVAVPTELRALAARLAPVLTELEMLTADVDMPPRVKLDELLSTDTTTGVLVLVIGCMV